MREISPCKDCTDRHTACHDSCDKYLAWKALHQAQQKHLLDTRDRMYVPMTQSRDKAYAKQHRYSRCQRG